MTEHDDDRDLRDRFEALRQEEAAAAPAFRQLWDASTRASVAQRSQGLTFFRWIAVAAAVTVIAGTATLYRATSRLTEPSKDRVLEDVAFPTAQWRAPTDFLLRTPGRDLFGTIPRIGISATANLINAVGGEAPATSRPQQ